MFYACKVDVSLVYSKFVGSVAYNENNKINNKKISIILKSALVK